ncbi:PAX3- and PAX7-binding protein 1-like [Macrosteles quadrilineatus]|uniref:PAX3- and PAX7-binding protein 1-like n=1 Tax=Macrosteles quadrilineatus TaxID=74068 RepID=UPI0023E317A4|nr:PAX3- and PAX7-binding protein 1-like [Macrosteles quadrilineatus]
MSVMKKPRRNIRRRDLDNDENDGEETEVSLLQFKKTTSNKTSEVKVKKEKKKPSVLSFEEEWNDADDGEVFQVKKSSHSKKIKKYIEKEKDKKKKKEDKPEDSEGREKTKEITFNNELTIKIKNNLPLIPILNGKEAEMAEIDGSSSEDEKATHKYSHPDSVKQLLKSGKIPDAAMIHAARKKRQQAREMGDFVPIEEDKPYDNKKGRLVREDENDMCDEDIRITMQVNTAAADMERRREAFTAAMDHQASEESDKGEEEEWEKQQIRKGVTGAQIAAAQQESMFYGYTMPQIPPEMNMAANSLIVEPMSTLPAAMTMPDMMMAPSKMDPQSVAKRLNARLQELREIHQRHVEERDAKSAELAQLKAECVAINKEAPTLAERFRFYQDLRGYVTDLVECLDEKIVVLSSLEQRLLTLYRKRTMDLINRRRQDMRDQAEELSPATKNTVAKRDEMQTRRAAEREGRRIRRMKAREAKGTQKHIEGMSSDDEVTEMETAMFRSQREQVQTEARHMFEDALDEFSTVHGVLQRFALWKRTDRDAYVEAYVHLCLAKALGPLIRLQILLWSPLSQGEMDLERTGWNQRLLFYGIQGNETEDILKADPDIELVPKIVEKVIIPKLDQLVSAQWDPMSRSQSLSLVNVVTKLLQDYPTLGPNSKSLTQLVNNIVDKLKDAVDNDVFIPIYPKATTDGRQAVFFQRQFASAVKLLGNIVRWQGLLSDEVVSQVALDSLLNRYLLMAIRLSEPIEAAHKCHMVGSVLPRVWLHTVNAPSQLMPFLNQVRTISLQLDINKPLQRDAYDKLSGILKIAP